MRRTFRGAGVAAAVAVATAVLVGCTNSTNGASDSAKAANAGGAAASMAGMPSPQRAGAGAGGGGKAAGVAAANAPLLDTGSKIRIAEMTVDVTRGHVASAANRAEAITMGVGGDVDSDDRTSGRDATAALVLRVPPPSLTSVLDQLSGLGKERSRQLSTTDVTQKVADVDSRVRSAQDSIVRLRALYDGAKKVADVIAIEQELNDREANLESLQAQQRALARQTAMATVTLTLQTAAVTPAKPAHHQSRGGFVGGLERGWHGFVAAASWFATALGTLLPFLLLLALLGVVGRVVWRRLPRRPAPVPAPSE